MDTVKVDIQKLQLLNERIVQTIDALNQLRMSVHGIQHTPAQVSPWGYSQPYGAYTNPSFGFTPNYQSYGQNFAQPQWASSPFATPFIGGLQHTSQTIPVPTVPVQTVATTQQNPYAQYTPFGQYGQFVAPYVAGLQHTSPTIPVQTLAATQAAMYTPYVGNGISHTTQTFPFAQLAYPPTLIS